MDEENRNFDIIKVRCVDKYCQSVMYVSSLEDPIECMHCGQRRDKKQCCRLSNIDSPENAMEQFVKRILVQNSRIKRGTELVRVLGMSNYYCKLLSPFLTVYGMDKETGQAVLLREMNQGDIFDCSLFGSRAFLIEPDHIKIPGFGRDVTGSMEYLSETLKLIVSSNGEEERLLPIHADGDGHCLVHAVSRALVGRELFWHPLRCCLKRLFENSLDKFKDLFQSFFDPDEWPSIVDECDPDFKPPENELLGLRNIHIFGLANVLKRPIILLDSLECMKKCGDYSAVFLPGFINPELCRGKDNSLNKPICIAWSSYSHNHYIPLVGVQGMPLPVLPRSLLPKVWGMPQSEIASYLEFDENDNCTIGGNRVLSDNYILRLTRAMEEVFIKRYQIHPLVIEDTKLYLCQNSVLLNNNFEAVLNKAKSLLYEGRLMRCLTCSGLCEITLNPSAFHCNGEVYKALSKKQKRFVHGASYILQCLELGYRIVCKYDSLNDVLIPDLKQCKLEKCTYCTSPLMEKLKGDGSPWNKEEREMNIKNSISNKNCQVPKPPNKADDSSRMLTLKVSWNNIQAQDIIPDFQLVSKENLLEAVANISASFISRHFPTETESPELQTYVAEQILRKIGKSFVFDSASGEFVDLLASENGSCSDATITTSSSSSEAAQASTSSSETDFVTAPEESSEVQSRISAPEAMDTEQKDDFHSKGSEPKVVISEFKCVKVVNNGQQANLTISSEGITYSGLQDWIKNTFSIPVQNQKIKIGFPPKELEVPVRGSSVPLSLKHGDRLMVESCAVPSSSRPASVRCASRDYSAASALTLSQREAMWNAAKKSPEQFQKGGKYYEEAHRSILHDMSHVILETFPNKTFSYNRSLDSLELCVKPLGHFLIALDMDSRIEQVRHGERVPGFRICPVMLLKPGYKDPLLNKAPKRPLSAKPQTSDSLSTPLVRKGPGFSVITSPESDGMDIS